MNLIKMKNKKIKLFDPHIGKEEEEELVKTLKSHFWASGEGTGKVKEFETNFNEYIGSRECVAVNNGTSALHLALSIYDIKNKEVILPSLSFISTANAILYNGGIPKFVDVDPETLCVDPELIKNAISNKTEVILPVHFGGFPCSIKEISEICKHYGIHMIEDAAHAAGATYNKKKIGSHGEAVCFSFHPVKNLAMPTGGAITLNQKNSKKISNNLKSERWCGITNRKNAKYDVKNLGWNFYMNEFSATIGLTQLKKLDKLNNIRKQIAKKYSKKINLEKIMPYNQNSSYHLFWITVKNRDSFMRKMSLKGIQTGIHYIPIHKMQLFHDKKKLPITEKISKQIVSLPIHPNLTDEDVENIIKCTNKFS